mmetsp:Transcript_6807/g.27821  ORF Transcript_6807/g.27821 Transcript_6807/m.27821 type:complete len:445 (+) Transcript_6807:182-1516(+)
MRTADGDVGSPEGSSEEDEDVSGSGSEDDSSGEDESEEGSGSEASEASEASGSELDLALAEDGRVACPLLPHLAGLDAFSSFPNAFALDDDDARRALLADCDEAFTARAATKRKGPYSSGKTYWLAADAEPRCALERLAKHVFDAHVGDAVKRFVANESSAQPFDASRSGAEWWTQVVDIDDEIGVHWDKDYGLEPSGLNVHPQIGTVTYFSSFGAPTLMARKPTPTFFSESVAGAFEDLQTHHSDREHMCFFARRAGLPAFASANAFLSFPAFGKHVAFDGRWLHGALPELSRKTEGASEGDGENDGENEKNPTRLTTTKRVTFLVNVWLNHVPSTATPLPERALSRMAKLGAYVFANGDTFAKKKSSDDAAVESVDVAKLGVSKEIQREFTHAESTFLMRAAFPVSWLEGEAPTRGGSFALVGTGGEVVEVRDSEKKKRKRA